MPAFVGAERVPGRMAGAAMSDSLDEITAAIPFRALLLVGLEDARPEEQRIPDPHHHAVVQRPAQFWRGRLVADGCQHREIGADRQYVVPGEFSEIGGGECRVIT